MLTDGQKVVTAYVTLYLLMPFVASWFLGDAIAGVYAVHPLTANVFVLVIGSFAGSLLLYRVRLLPPLRLAALRRSLIGFGRLYLRGRIVVAAFALTVSVLAFVWGLNSYRYTTEAISGIGSRLLLVAATVAIVTTADLCYCIFVRHRYRPHLTVQRRIEDALLGAALLVFANGTASLIIAGLIGVCVLWPRTARRFLFVRRRSVTPIRVLKALTAAVALAAFVPLAWVAGETIKRSSAGVPLTWQLLRNETARITSTETLSSWGTYLVSTFSTHYYSVRFAAGVPREEVLMRSGVEPALLPMQSALFRFDYLLGGPFGIPRPELGSMSRLNYVLLTPAEVQSDRAGTSPGLVASFAYVLPFPLSIAACALYARAIARAIDDALGRRRADVLSAVGVGLLLLLVLNALQSPLDVLILFDEGAMYLLLLTAIVLCHRAPRGSRVQAGASAPGRPAPDVPELGPGTPTFDVSG
jgi:hypothetical protein